jgi:putative tryptophan/tyrosine transport system substrate-binding protein
MQVYRILVARSWCFAVMLSAVWAPSVAAAEQPKHIPIVGFLTPVARADYDPTKDPMQKALLEGLHSLGYIEGKNIRVDHRVPRKPEDVAEMVGDLVARKVDVVATMGPEPIEAARRATTTIPIVIIACDRVDNLVATIARPGGNITGMACISSDLAAKRLQLLQEAVPGLSRVSVLFNGGVKAKVEEWQDIQATAKALEMMVQPFDVRDPLGFTPAFAEMKTSNTQALLALSEPLTFMHVKEIAAFAREQRLPSMYGFRELCDSGGLLCYGVNLLTLVSRYSYFIDKILTGTKPGDIPVEEPKTLELIVNARTADTIGLGIPNTILLRADEVIE